MNTKNNIPNDSQVDNSDHNNNDNDKLGDNGTHA